MSSTLAPFALPLLLWLGWCWLVERGARFLPPSSLVDAPDQWRTLAAAACLPGAIAVLVMALGALLPSAQVLAPHESLASMARLTSGALEVIAAPPIVSLETLALVPAAAVAVWLAIAALRLGALAQRWRTLRAIARAAIPAGRDPGERWPVFATDAALPPLALPAGILVPAALIRNADTAALRRVLQHEAAHLACRDPHWLLALEVARTVLWPSPAFARLVQHWRDATELRADHVATASANADERIAYAQQLLNTARAAAHPLAGPAAAMSPDSHRSLRMRIEQLIAPSARPRASVTRRRLTAAVATLACFVGTSGVLSASPGPTRNLLVGHITLAFGEVNPAGRHHTGVDIAAPRGTPLASPVRGRVVAATDNYRGSAGWGNVVEVETPNGLAVMFAHLDRIDVKVGQRVARGDVLGTVGSTGKSTGPHVHVETWQDGERVNPEDVFASMMTTEE